MAVKPKCNKKIIRHIRRTENGNCSHFKLNSRLAGNDWSSSHRSRGRSGAGPGYRPATEATCRGVSVTAGRAPRERTFVSESVFHAVRDRMCSVSSPGPRRLASDRPAGGPSAVHAAPGRAAAPGPGRGAPASPGPRGSSRNRRRLPVAASSSSLEPAALQTQALYVFSLKCFQGGDKAGSGRINMFHSGAYSFSKALFPLCSPGGGEDKGPRGHLRAVTPQRGRDGARRRFSTETRVAVHPGAPAAWRQGLGHLLLAVAGDSAGQEGLGCEPWRPIRSATPLQPKGPSSRAGVIPPASFET